MMRALLKEKGIILSNSTVHKYMNKELKLKSITRKIKPKYIKGESHKTFENHVKQNFCTEAKNKIWCTDFTYLHLTDGSMRYNCTVIDLYDRRVVATLSSKTIDTKLAIDTLEIALKKNKKIDGLILHSDQGSQYTSHNFTDYCERNKIIQSMSKSGCPYDNAPMERYFNTLKAELINQKYYHNEEELYRDIATYAYDWYNEQRPHSYNGYMPPNKVA